MRLQLCDGLRESWGSRRAALLFLSALILLHRPVMSAGFFSWAGITAFTEGLFVLLALGLLLFRWNEVRDLLKNSSLAVKVPFYILLLSGVLHWLAAGYYHPEFLGMALAWSILPLFGAVYRKDLEKLLPGCLAVFWYLNAAVCIITESFSEGMFGLTGNWNWSAFLLAVSAPFAVIKLPENWKIRKFAAAGIVIVTAVLLFVIQSRAILLSLVFAAMIFCFLKFRKSRTWMVFAAAAVLAAAAGGGLVAVQDHVADFRTGAMGTMEQIALNDNATTNTGITIACICSCIIYAFLFQYQCIIVQLYYCLFISYYSIKKIGL